MVESFDFATLVGCAIGDAAGNPFEMKAAISPALKEWDGLFKEGGTFWWGQPGQYTDDTLMSIALATSLIENQGFNGEDVANKYLAWMNSGNTRGIGGTTAQALSMLKLGATWKTSGLKGSKIGGNGTAMRATPIGIAYRNNLPKLMEVAMQDASITHNSLEPQMGSVAVALATALLTDPHTNAFSVINEVASTLLDSVVQQKIKLAIELWDNDKIEPTVALAQIGSAGYVPETVGAAFYCLLKNNNFKDTIVMAIKAGGDTDTTAAIAGGLAGTYWGLEDIPEEYRSVENYQFLQDLQTELNNVGQDVR